MAEALPACCVGDEDAAKNGTDDSTADDFKSPDSKDDHTVVEHFELGAMTTNAAVAGRRQRKLPRNVALINSSLNNSSPSCTFKSTSSYC